MPSFNPFSSVTGRNAVTLFEIRLDSDFLVFRGNEHESSGQLLKGTVVLCLPSPLKVEDIHLRLTGTLHLSWTDSKVTPTGISSQKVDKTSVILNHRWKPFVGIGAADSSSTTRAITLPAGNYEWPFELELPGNTSESVEGLPEASITYKLKATVARGKLAYDLHAYKRLRIIRTLESSALEFLHSMSVENIWPNKVEYSILIPRKAIVFGSSVPLEMRFTPLLKGLELGDITIRLVEVHDIIVQGPTGHALKEHKKEREVTHWTVPMSREEHWCDMIEDTGQEGWVMSTTLDLPRKIGKCVQDVNVQGIKIRHKLKMVVALKNPDGHISELRATLPVTIFISPNMPLDDEGNLVHGTPLSATPEEARTMAPPTYGDHVLDEIFRDAENDGLQTPGLRSGMSSPFYTHSRAGSTENLAAMLRMSDSTEITAQALQSRLQNVSLDPSHRNSSWQSMNSLSGAATPHYAQDSHLDPMSTSAPQSAPHSAPLSRQDSPEHSSGSTSPQHLDIPDLTQLSKVPSYQTAVRTPVKPLTVSSQNGTLPDYRTAVSAPSSPVLSHAMLSPPPPAMTMIPEASHEDGDQLRRTTMGARRQTTGVVGLSPFHPSFSGEMDEPRRLHLMRARERIS
ncbi:hypothetical protein CONLIGDRAFT_583411 [Coniochaeta ligniaria NRRL 30616]|uniref:Arrestin C-terminal-like domain-containing protein n=1 Tax=Coniochaeta ligniaria NRRL 30616 TaxID=1408157 RepID=A0A1J7ICP0_9PEZI|nr:hypothetical protein CONLIGDRAFT_583411 [Coniochaeta ligniaria NRRL 30616]